MPVIADWYKLSKSCRKFLSIVARLTFIPSSEFSEVAVSANPGTVDLSNSILIPTPTTALITREFSNEHSIRTPATFRPLTKISFGHFTSVFSQVDRSMERVVAREEIIPIAGNKSTSGYNTKDR